MLIATPDVMASKGVASLKLRSLTNNTLLTYISIVLRAASPELFTNWILVVTALTDIFKQRASKIR
jgi:hypothetical protein